VSEFFEKMFMEAKNARENAHTPYSGFKVGACLRSESGELFSSGNIENAAYPNCLCAEAVAVGKLASSGQREIKEVLVVADVHGYCAPCGSCRQQIKEFSKSDTIIHLCNMKGENKTVTMRELMPYSFSSKTMKS
jgi:cytidine deaminase